MKLEKEIIHSSEAPKGRGPFPQALKYGNLVFVSGQGPLDSEKNEPDTGSFEKEVRLTFNNLEKIVKAAGCNFADALNLTIYLTDLANVPQFNEIYQEYFPEPRPARTLVQVVLRGIQVEVAAIFQCKR